LRIPTDSATLTDTNTFGFESPFSMALLLPSSFASSQTEHKIDASLHLLTAGQGIWITASDT
jgi:hypothetical protein